MKILFVQYWYDFFGGIETVNDSLATQFMKDGNDVTILCLWNTGKNEIIEKSKNYEKKYISKYFVKPSMKIAFKNLLKLKLKEFALDVIKRIKYVFIINKNHKDLTKKILSINPDYIIVGTPELLKDVPSIFLSKTIMHLHLGFKFWNKNIKCLKAMKKYKNKVKKIVWLSPTYMNMGIRRGYINSTYIYNPVRIESKKDNNLKKKIVVFIGRIAPEKRVDLLADIFNEFAKNNSDWHLNIYGSGDTSNIKTSNNVHLMGVTKDVKTVLENSSLFLLTSSYEGFPMVILEAYECGVPTIAFDFEIASSDVVKNGKTGYIIENDDINQYLAKLNKLCSNINERQEMGKNAKKFANDFKPEIIAKRWYMLFEDKL